MAAVGIRFDTRYDPDMSQEAHVGGLKCDNCTKAAQFRAEGELPAGWTPVRVRGWVGDLHVCSPKCLGELLDRCASGGIDIGTN